MHKQPSSPQSAALAVDFMRWALENGQRQAESLNYVSLPVALVQQIEAYWAANFSGFNAALSENRN